MISVSLTTSSDRQYVLTGLGREHFLLCGLDVAATLAQHLALAPALKATIDRFVVEVARWEHVPLLAGV